MLNQKNVERNSLIISAIVNICMAGAGIWVFAVTNLYALLLDGFFSLIGCVSSVTAMIISQRSQIRTKTYPDGRYFLEPLYAVFKSALTLALLVISCIVTAKSAFYYFYHGIGEPMEIGPILPYTVCMVILCFGLGAINIYHNKKINLTSTILTAESKSNIIDGLLSLGVGIAVIAMSFVSINGPLGFLHYTGDFFITLLLVLISIKEPVRVLLLSFHELSGGTVSDNVICSTVKEVVHSQLRHITDHVRCDIFKVGMHIQVRISLSGEILDGKLELLDRARNGILLELNKSYDSVEVRYAF